MRKTKPKYFNVMWLLVIAILFSSSCKDDDEVEPILEERVYAMQPVSDPDISGTIVFSKQNETTTLVTITLVGTTAGDMHPAHIHGNSAEMGGPIVIDLNSVDGATGQSETLVSQLDNGTPITYEGLLAFDGHANVHLSPTQMATLIAQGNIGANSP